MLAVMAEAVIMVVADIMVVAITVAAIMGATQTTVSLLGLATMGPGHTTGMGTPITRIIIPGTITHLTTHIIIHITPRIIIRMWFMLLLMTCLW
jgi:hypothetical protein